MSKHKFTNLLCIVIIGVMLVLTVLFMCGESLGVVPASADGSGEDALFSEQDLDGTSDADSAVSVDLGDPSGTASGVRVSDGDFYIVSGGTYVLSGELQEDKRVVVEAEESQVKLVLNGVTIQNTTRAPILVDKADKVFLTLEEGSVNRLGVSGTLSDAQGDITPNAAVYSKSDLSINGNGTLEVETADCNGIRSSDDLVIASGSIRVDAGENGIVGHDSLRICGGTIQVKAAKDGMKSNNDSGGEDKGFVVITGGELQIDAADDAIRAETDLTIDDGKITVASSYEGIEGTHITVNGGEIDVTASDDGINAGGGTGSFGGGFQHGGGGRMMRQQDGTDGQQQMPEQQDGADGQRQMPEQQDGAGDLQQMPEQQDGAGDLRQMPEQQDGAGDLQQMPKQRDGTGDLQQMPQQQGQAENDDAADTSPDEQPTLEINGGSIHVDAGGDGLDSNGDLTINGGSVIVDGPENSGNGAIDSGTESGGECVINGGTVLALGASGMAEGFSENSKQYSFVCTFEESFAAGDKLEVKDGDGKSLITYTVKKSGNSVVFGSPDLAKGMTCTVTVGDRKQEITLDSVASGEGGQGFMRGGGMRQGGGMRPDGQTPDNAGGADPGAQQTPPGNVGGADLGAQQTPPDDRGDLPTL